MKTQQKLVETRRRLSAHVERWQRTIDTHSALFERLESFEGMTIRFAADYDGSVDLHFAGDVSLLRMVWRELRLAGFKPDGYPQPNQVTYGGYWRKEGVALVWMYFTSTSCQRVKVGTVLKEIEVYEMRCGGDQNLGSLEDGVG